LLIYWTSGYCWDQSGNQWTFDVDGDEIARITPTGVGIGTTSPSSLLELSGVSNPQITLDGTTTSGYRGLIFAYDGTGFGQIGQNVQSGELIIRSGESGQTGYFINFSVNGSDAARIDSSGSSVLHYCGWGEFSDRADEDYEWMEE
jgi:hypothetical protein